MKILYNNKLYIQMSDLMFLYDYMNMPHFIFKSFYKHFMNMTPEKVFIEFTETSEIDFFQECDWILDFNIANKYTTDQIRSILEELRQEKKQLLSNQYYQIFDISLIEYKAKIYYDLLCFKLGKNEIPFPIIPNLNTYSIIDKTFTYEVRPNIEGNMLLFYRKDRKQLTDEDFIKPNLIRNAIAISTLDKINKDDYTLKKYFSEDKMYFIIEFKINHKKNSYLDNIKNLAKKLIK